MIQSKSDYKYYQLADEIALGIYGKSIVTRFMWYFYIKNWKFQRLLRKTEYYTNTHKTLVGKLFSFWLQYRLKIYGCKLGYTIPINVFGPGLALMHTGTIIVSKEASIGKNCRCHACVNIGTGRGAPRIGDNCYIGPGVKIFNDIDIANNTSIGANAVVNKSFLDSNTTIAGVPAKIVKHASGYVGGGYRLLG